MRIAIDNDLQTLYARIDYSLMQKTTLDRDFGSTSSAVIVQNSAGFGANDFIVIGDPGEDNSEILKISTVTAASHQINFSTGYDLSLAHSKRDDVYRIAYDQVKFYEDDVLLDTVDITPDFWVPLTHAVDTDKYYHITFYNSETTTETAAGEKIKGYNKLLCSISDIYQWESSEGIGIAILDKMEIATREILSTFINQGQDISLLSNFDVLRMACAALALKYYFMAKRKSKDDISTLKSKDYDAIYKAKIIEATETINKQEDDVQVFGQTRCDR